MNNFHYQNKARLKDTVYLTKQYNKLVKRVGKDNEKILLYIKNNKMYDQNYKDAMINYVNQVKKSPEMVQQQRRKENKQKPLVADNRNTPNIKKVFDESLKDLTKEIGKDWKDADLDHYKRLIKASKNLNMAIQQKINTIE